MPSTHSGRFGTTSAHPAAKIAIVPPKGFNAPAQADTVGDPPLHFGIKFRKRVSRREDFHHEIRREGQVSLALFRVKGGETAPLNPARVRTESRAIGQVESRVGAESYATAIPFGPGKEFMNYIGFAAIVLKAAGSHHNNLS